MAENYGLNGTVSEDCDENLKPRQLFPRGGGKRPNATHEIPSGNVLRLQPTSPPGSLPPAGSYNLFNDTTEGLCVQDSSGTLFKLVLEEV